MVPGKTHLSLTIAWALEYDPVAAVAAAAKTIPEDEAFDEHQTQQRQQQSLQEAASQSPGKPPVGRQRSTGADSLDIQHGYWRRAEEVTQVS